MAIALLVICMIASIACSIWALVIIFKRTIVGGLLTLFLGLPILYFLVTGWGKEGQDIKKPFFLSFILYGVAIAIGMSMGFGAAKEMQDQLQQEMAAPKARPSFRETTTPAVNTAPARETTPVSAQPAPRPEPIPAVNIPAIAAPAPAPSPAPRAAAPQRTAPPTEAPRTLGTANSGCVYKPVMTDEDLAKCR